MSVLKLSKNDIIRGEGNEGKRKLKKSDIIIDTTPIGTWEQTNRQALDLINNYNDKINKGEWLSKIDRTVYRKALDTYIETSNNLRGINKSFGEGYSEEDEKKWLDSVASMNEAYDATERYYSQWTDGKDYRGERDGWFQKSNLWDDGYQFGDVAKTIGGTVTDLGENIVAGVAGMGEAALDALVTIAPYFTQSQYYSNGGGYNLQADQAFDQSIASTKDWSSDFVEKDLYDEGAIAKAIIADPVKALTGIDAETDSVFGEKMDSLAQSGGQLLGTAGLQAVGVPWWLTTGVTTFGGEAENAVIQGATLDEAAFSGLVSAGAEILTEKISGGISFGGKTLDDVIPRLTSKISNKVVRNLVDLGIDMVGEGGEEVLSGVMGAIGQKLSYASDKKLLGELLTREDLWDSFIGGAILSGVGGLGDVAQLISGTNKARKAYGGSAGVDLVYDTLAIDPDSKYAHKMKARLDAGKDLTGSQLYSLEDVVVSHDIAKIKVATEARLTELGETGDVSEIAEAIAKSTAGEKLTKAEKTLITNSKYGIDVAKDLNPNNIMSGEYDTAWAEGIGTKLVNKEAYNKALYDLAATASGVREAVGNDSVAESEANFESSTETDFEEFKGGKDYTVTAVMSDGEGNDVNVKVSKVVEAEDGGVSLELEDGKTVKAEDVDFGESGVDFVYKAAVDMVSGLGGFNAGAANIMVRGFNPSGTKAQAGTYVMGFNAAYRYGALGYPVSALARGVETSKLTVKQREMAYNLGKAYGVGKVSEKQAKIDSEKAKTTGKASKKGKVYFDGSTAGKSLTERQRASLKGLKVVAEAMGIDIHVFESKLVDGKRVGENGSYDPVTKTLRIDLYAGVKGDGLMLFTASHELTHHIREVAPAKFKIFADVLLEEYAKNGVSLDALIEAKLEHLERNGRLEGKTESEAYDLAYEEVVADACEAMLVDSNAMEALSKKLYAKDKSLWESVKKFIGSLIAKIKAIYKNLNPDSAEANLVREMKDSAERLQKLWVDALLEASEVGTSIGTINLNDFADAKNENGEPLFQYRAMEADEATYRKMLSKWGKMSTTQINNLFATIDNAMELIKDNLEILDYAWEADIDDRAFLPVKPNSDKLYQVSLDFSTLCRKRILQQMVVANLQEALNKPLTREEGIAIRDALIALQEEGRQIEVACALCYVESARMKSPEQIKRFIENREKVIKEFFAGKSGGSIKEKIKQAEDDVRAKLYKENPNGILGKDGETKLNPLDAKLKQLPKKYADAIRDAKRAAKESYKPTAEEQRLIDAANRMTVSDFTTPEGLETLAKNYPRLFDAYTSYIRNATKSKGIEGDTWWRAGDSSNIGDVLIANMNRENGLRSQSWSDFQVIHILDYIASTIELATRNTKEQAYSKVPDYVELMGLTGVMINMSLIPTAKFNGSLDYDSVEGIDYKRALELRDKYHKTAGTICIGVDNVQIKLLLADTTIDYVIPYHKSGMSKAVRKLMHIPTWSQYEEYQSEKNLSRADAEKQAKKYGVKLLDASDPNYHKDTSFSEWFDIQEAQQIAKMENANPTDKAKQKQYGVMYGGYMAMQNAANNYLKLCAERGLSPKFSHEKADFTAEDNYWKLLIDRKMVDNVTGEVIEQQTIKPIFSESEVMRILNDEVARYPKVKADQDYAIRTVTEKMLSGEIKGGMSAKDIAKVMKKPVDNVTNVNILASAENSDIRYSDRDSLGNELTKEQQEFFKDSKVRDENGSLLAVYHGTEKGGFTKFEISDDIGYFFTDRLGVAWTYSGTYDEYAPKRFESWDDAIAAAEEIGIDLYLDEDSGKYILDGYSEWDQNELDSIAEELKYYAEERKVNYSVYLNLKSPLIVNGNGSNWDNVVDYYEGGEFVTYEELTEEQIEGFLDNGYEEDDLRPFTNNGYESLPIFDVANFSINYPMSTRDWVAEAQAGGYDGVIFKDISDDGKYGRGYSNESNVYVALESNQIKSTANKNPTDNIDIRYSDRVTDKKILDFLENQEHVTVYRAMQVIDGELYPPMAAKVKSDDGKKKLVTPSKIGAWEQAVERPDLIRNGNKFELDKANGSSIQAAYNPYFHTSASPLNDQFSSAYKRPNLVIVEGEIPASELTSGYRAEFAKDTVGETKWHSGPVASKLKGDKARRVFLSRWFKPVRIVPDSEVASIVAKTLGGENIDVPYNVVTPTLRAELEKAGVSIKYQDRGTDSYSNRSLLAGALESAVQNDIEREKLKQYKAKIDLINSEEQKLHNLREQIKELSFKKGPRDTEAIRKLQFEANQAANRINTYDRQLLNLESTKALKGVLEREKAQARKRDAQKYKEAIDRYREKSAKTQRELMTRYQESRKKATESRNKTAMRHKIKDIVSELNTLLLKPTAKKHIKEELRKEVADALSAINMDTIGADERVAMYNDLIAKESNPDVIAELKKTRDRIQLQGDNLQEKLATLQMAYEKIKNTDDIELNLAYQEVIHNSIKAVSEKVGKTSIRNMTLEQLEMVYDLFNMIRHTIRAANKSFTTEKGETIMQMAEAVNDQVRTVGGQPYKRNAISATLQRIGWTFLKPYVAFRTIGSVTLTNIYKKLRAGEDTFYGDVKEAQALIEEQYKKHGYKSWDMKKTKKFTAKSGKSFDLTLEQMMSLYAYSKREQAHKHIIEGGIVFEDALIVEKNKAGIPIKYEVTTKDAFNLSEETFAEIANSLTAEQKAFVDEMQAYLSDTMGAKGNEVSMKLLGVKLFKEKFYLPIKSSQDYMKRNPEEAGEVKLKSPAFSKETVPTANNPIVLHNFTDLWAEHINNMSMYHSFVLALEDFTKVYYYKTKTDAKVETMSTQATLETAYPGVTKYIDKFLKDMNGGVRGETVGWAEKLTSLSKKGAVLGSASVTIQQPSAVMRAMAYINPKYFVATAHKSINLVKHKQDFEELKRYAPIAGIKEMGRFDVGMGQATVDWIKSDKTVMDKAEDILSLPPAFMDEVTWITIWNAVKRETVSKYKNLSPKSEEFLKIAGERFTDVISLSQVYDSVFSRSDLMRNKSWIAKSLTAFMAEPTTTLNMIWDSWVQGKRTGSAKGFAKTTASVGGAIVSATVLNAALKSIIMAMRDDDEDESYAEKYLEHFVGDIKDSLNPLTLVPFAKDIVSIFNGYDVERMDMALFSDLKKAIDAFDSEEKTLYEKWSGLIGATSAFFGVPVKNVERDVRGLITTVFGKTEETTEMGLLNAIKEGWTGKEISKGQQLYEAILKGDSEQVKRVEGRFKNQNEIDAAIRKALRENDPRMKEAAQAYLDGDYATYNKLRDKIVAEGNFSWQIINDALKAEYNYLKKKAKEDK